MSQITTHVLDTTSGRPASGIMIVLYQSSGGDWTELARGVTNADGRITDLLKDGNTLQPGNYKMHFGTKPYFENQLIDTFYPYVEIVFHINNNQHYHIPLLLSPFGYSTYRGS